MYAGQSVLISQPHASSANSGYLKVVFELTKQNENSANGTTGLACCSGINSVHVCSCTCSSSCCVLVFCLLISLNALWSNFVNKTTRSITLPVLG